MLTNGSAAQILLTFSDLEMDKKLLARVADLSTKKTNNYDNACNTIFY